MIETADNISRIEALRAEGTVEAAGILTEIAVISDDKSVRKAARTALFKLGQAGIQPDGVAVRSAHERRVEIRAFASAFDGAGNRILFFLKSDRQGGWPTLVQVLFNDETGLTGVDSLRAPQRDLEERIGKFGNNIESGIAFAEIETENGRRLLAEARNTDPTVGRTIPRSSLDRLEGIGEPAGQSGESAIYDWVSIDTVASDETIPKTAASLFALPWFEAWFLSEDDVEPWREMWIDAGTREATAVDDHSDAALDAIVAVAAATLLTDRLRRLYVRRLEETGDILRRCNHELPARIALVHALALAQDTPAKEIDFARELVRRTFLALETPVEESSEDSDAEAAVA